jgi:hypothetical protein
VRDLDSDQLERFEVLLVFALAEVTGDRLRDCADVPNAARYDRVRRRSGRSHCSLAQTAQSALRQPELSGGSTVTELQLDISVDLNTMDETGLPWTYLDQATDPARITVGAYVLVGGGSTRAVARVVDVSAEGVVHVLPLPSAPSDHVHLLAGRAAS